MRILYFTRNYTPHDHRFLTSLAKTRHKVYYLRLEKSSQPLEKRALPSEIELVKWRRENSQLKMLDSLGLAADLRRIIQEIKPDIIQAGPIQRTAFLVALTGFQPLVSMSWGYDLLIDAKRNHLWRWATRYTLKKSAALVADCDTLRQEAILNGMPNEKIVTFPWGIDLEHFSAQKDTQINKTKAENNAIHRLLSTRSWEPMYGVDTIAKAFIIASRKRPDFRLIMLGNGSQSELLHKLFEDAGLMGKYSNPRSSSLVSQVVFPGQISFQELPRYYRSADLYIAASHSDGTSISLLEAMACGCPALVSDIPGNREWVIPGENGWLFPKSDAEALANAILRAFDQPQQLHKMGKVARHIAEERADWTKNFPKLFNAYDIALTECNA